jgi:hypothetical protein
MTTCDDVRTQLDGFVDGELAPDARAMVTAHLRECPACRDLASDIDSVVAAARSLGPVAPPEHLWIEIAGQLRHTEARPVLPQGNRSGGRAAWQWIGLAAALLAVTTAIYVVRRPSSAPAETAASAGAADSMQTVSDELALAMRHYERAIAGLEAVARGGDGQMDPAVSASLRRSLGSIDSAISESRAALVANPDSGPARDSLFEALRRKVSVLQATVSLINQMRQGDPAGASRAMEGLGRQS